nr:immunoglobulin light chain junction region [Macaca mulatta]
CAALDDSLSGNIF